MNPNEKTQLNSLHQDQDEDLKEGNDQEKEHEKDAKESEKLKENENETDDNSPIGFEVIELYSDKAKTNIFKKLKKYYTLIGVLLFIVLSLSVFCFFIFANKNKDEETNPLNYSVKKSDGKQSKKASDTSTSKKAVGSSEKMTVGFLYPWLTSFMVNTGEQFIQSGKYNVIFITKTPGKKEYSYNKNIKRVTAYYNHKEILKAIKSHNIDYLVINDAYSIIEINWLKSLGIRLIGVLDDIYTSKKSVDQKKVEPNYKNLELYDAFIQETVEDYNNLQKLNFKRNVYIPTLFNIGQQKVQTQLLLNHNIVAFGGLYDKNAGARSMINSMPLILKDFPKAKLNIISNDNPSKDLNQLITKLKLTKNVNILPVSEKLSELLSSSSIFIYASSTSICPLILNEAKANSLSCIISSAILDTPLTNTGVIRTNISNSDLLSKEVIKIYKDNKYRKKTGRDAKLSIDKYNEDIIKLWERLFTSLKAGDKDFQRLRLEIECLFTKKELPKPPVKVEPKKETAKVPAKPAKTETKKETPKATTKPPHKKEVQKTPTKTEYKKETEVYKKPTKTWTKKDTTKVTTKATTKVESKKLKKSQKTKKHKEK